MQAGVRLIDYLLRKHEGVYEFTQDPECIFRLQSTTAPHAVTMGAQTIRKGDPVLGLHVWNERMPQLPIRGADIEWAFTIRRRLVRSFRGIAAVMLSDPHYSPVVAVCGVSALLSFTGHTGGTQMLQRLGFTVIPYYRPFGRFGEFWENLFSWWLMWTYNTHSLQTRQFWDLERTEIWITRQDFLQRFC